MSNGNVGNVEVKSWDNLDYHGKRAACLWYNREIKQMPFGAFILAHLQAMFTCAEKTVQKMNNISKAFQLRNAIVDKVPKTKAEDVKAALDMLKPNDNAQNQSVAQTDNQTQGIQQQIQEFLTLADVNGDIKKNLIEDLKIAINRNTLEGKLGRVSECFAEEVKKIGSGITNKSKSEDVKKQLTEVTTNFDKDVAQLLGEAVENCAITEKVQAGLLGKVANIKTQTTQSINEKIAILEKKEAQATRKAANEGKNNDDLLDGLTGENSKLSPEDKQTLQQVRAAANATEESAEKTRAQHFLNLIVSELKEGREVSNLTELFSEKDKEIGDEIFDAINKGNLGREHVKNANIDTLPKLTEKLKDETFRKELFKESQFAQDCARLNGKNPVDAYGMTCGANVPENIKTLINKWHGLKFDSSDNGAVDSIRKELGSQEQDINNLYRDYTAKVMSDLYAAMEENSKGSGAQLLFTYCQTVDGTVFGEFAKEMKNKGIFKETENFSMLTVQENGKIVPINEGNLPSRTLSMHFSGTKPIGISYGYHVDCKFAMFDSNAHRSDGESFIINQTVCCVADVKYSYKDGNLECSQVNCLTAVFENGTQAVVQIENNDAKENEFKTMRVVKDIIPASANEPKGFTA